MDSLQLDQLFRCVWSITASTGGINDSCRTLMNLYTERNNLNIQIRGASNSNGDINELLTVSQLFDTIKIEIDAVESIFKEQLCQMVKTEMLPGSVTAFKGLLCKFGIQLPDTSSSSNTSGVNAKFNTEDLITFFALKARLTDTAFHKSLSDDVVGYTMGSALGSLSAKNVFESKYGKVITNLFESSFLGGDNKGGLSQMYLGTVYNVLNNGDSGFSLSCLCMTGNKPSDTTEAQVFGNVAACEGANFILNTQVINDIMDYYTDLASK